MNLFPKVLRGMLHKTAVSICWTVILMFTVLPAHAADIGVDKLSSNPSESAGPVTVDVQASVNVVRDTLVTYTVSGTSSNLDHDLANGSVYILNGTNTAAISFNLLDDSDYEGDETVIITITSVGTGSTVGAQNFHTMTIADDEAVPSLSLTPMDAAESNGGTQMQVVSDTLSAFDINFSYSTIDGTAVAGTHYTSTSGSGTITAGSLDQTVSVPVSDDSDNNADRTFTFKISNANLSNGTTVTISESTDTATIIDDDLAISIDDVSVNESAGTATLFIRLPDDSRSELLTCALLALNIANDALDALVLVLTDVISILSVR